MKIAGENSGVDGAQDIELKDDNVYILSYMDNGMYFSIICYDTTGNYRWSKLSDIGYGSTYMSDLAVDGTGDIIIGAPLYLGLFTGKYSVARFNKTAVTDTSGTPLRVENQILVKFNPEVVRQATIDKRGKVFGTAKEFIQDSTIAKLNAILGFDIANKDSVTFVKVYKHLTTGDSISYGRSGNPVEVPQFWSMLLMILPNSVTIDSTLFDTLATAWPDVYYSKANGIYTPFGGANDPQYNEQECLHATIQYPYGDINMEPAWDYEEGDYNVRVGVYDSGINYNHEDLTGTCAYGWDYLSDCPMNYSPYGPDDNFHGTACAGLIGAKRNNHKGIAGIAGVTIQQEFKGSSYTPLNYMMRITIGYQKTTNTKHG